jgi:prenyltransferase/squalene oxidase-like repeat protein
MRPLVHIPAALFLCAAIGCAQQKPPVPTTQTVYARPIDQAISDGVAFLESSQNPDGSWGTGTVSHGNEIVASVPGSHEAFRVAVTSLCVMALREAGEKEAHDRGVEYLLSHFDVRRADAELIYNVWAHTYIVQALAAESRSNSDPRIRQVIQFHLDRMARYETYVGGWNYYDFSAGTQQPSMEPTSFGTAAGLVALHEAQQAGFDVDPKMIQRCMRRLEEMRLPNGACLYGGDYKYLPLLPADTPRGSAGRAVAVDYALNLFGSPKVNESACRAGLDLFIQEHAALEMGRKRPYPHESWYQVSGYYYYFDHYYAARLLSQLDPQYRRQYALQLMQFILPHQEPDGSWWDYPMWDYHKPYGTAFAIMTLLRCKS